MKFKNIALSTVLALFAVGCSSEDNYSEPKSSIEGGIYDLSNKDQLIPAQAPDGARIRIFEGSASQSENFWCKSDGSFENKRVFPAFYRIIPEGPFIVAETDTIKIDIPAKEKINFYVEPYLRIHLKGNLSNGDKDINYEFSIEKSSKWDGQLNQYTILYSTTAHIDANSFKKNNIVEVTADQESEVLGKTIKATIKDIQPNRPVYIRIGARTTGTDYYNYSETIKLK